MSVDSAISDASKSLMHEEETGDWTKVQNLLTYYPEFKDLPKTGRLDFQTKDAIDNFYKNYFLWANTFKQKRKEELARGIYINRDIPIDEDSRTEDAILQGELNAMIPDMAGMEPSSTQQDAYRPAPPMSPPVDMDIRRPDYPSFDILGLDPEELDWLEGLDEYPDPMPLSGDR